MNAQKARDYGSLAGMLFILACWGVNWLITPMAHPEASRARELAVVAQVLISGALALWCWRLATRESRPTPAT